MLQLPVQQAARWPGQCPCSTSRLLLLHHKPTLLIEMLGSGVIHRHMDIQVADGTAGRILCSRAHKHRSNALLAHCSSCAYIAEVCPGAWLPPIELLCRDLGACRGMHLPCSTTPPPVAGGAGTANAWQDAHLDSHPVCQ